MQISTSGYHDQYLQWHRTKLQPLQCTVSSSKRTLDWLERNFKQMCNKPKFYFVQICLGEQIDHGEIVCGTIGEDSPDVLTIFKVRSMAGTIVCYLTVPGFYSWRNSVKGSWFFQYLIRALAESSGRQISLSPKWRPLSVHARWPSSWTLHKSKPKPTQNYHSVVIECLSLIQSKIADIIVVNNLALD